MQVDLSSLATPVEPKKRVSKKRKAEEETVEERPVKGGKSIESFPIKEKKAPTEKQLAAREKLRLARLEKIQKVKEEKEKLDAEVKKKQEEVELKKAELAERRRQRREEKKKLLPQLPLKTSEPGQTGKVENLGPTISEALSTISNQQEPAEPVQAISLEPVPEEKAPETPKVSFQDLPVEPVAPNAPARTYDQRFRKFPFGKSIPTKPRFR